MVAVPKATKATDHTLMFWCPGCQEAHGVKVDGSRGWTWNGDLDRPVIHPSILVTSGHHSSGHTGDCWCNFEERFGYPPGFKCTRCHSFVGDADGSKPGMIVFLSDCSHELAGQTVELPEWGSQWSA